MFLFQGIYLFFTPFEKSNKEHVYLKSCSLSKIKIFYRHDNKNIHSHTFSTLSFIHILRRIIVVLSIYLLFFCVSVFCLSGCLCPCVMPMEVRRRCQSSWNWSWTAVSWHMSARGSSLKALSALDQLSQLFSPQVFKCISSEIRVFSLSILYF